MPDIEGVPYETTGTPLDQASAQALAARNREAISAGVAAGTEAKALAQQTADALVPRMEHIETMAGLAPGDVTDAQTANLISQPSTATRDALNAALEPTAAKASAAQVQAADAVAQVEALSIIGGVSPGDISDATVGLHLRQPASEARSGVEALLLDASTNLFDRDRVTTRQAYAAGAGTPSASSVYAISDWIPVQPDAQHTYGGTSIVRATYFDASRARISDTTLPVLPVTHTMGSTARWVRLTVPIANISDVQMNRGDTLLPFEVGGAATVKKRLVPDRAIGPHEAAFMQAPTNLFDKHAATEGFVYSAGTGVLTAHSAYAISDWIPVKSFTDYTHGGTTLRVTYFDEARQFVSDLSFSTWPTTHTVPPTVKWARVSVSKGNLGTAQMNEGTTLAPYSAGGYTLDPVFLPPEDTTADVTTDRFLVDAPGLAEVYTAPAIAAQPDLDATLTADVHGWYDALVTAHPDYVTRTDLGLSSDGTNRLYSYTLKAPRVPTSTDGTASANLDTRVPAALLISGVHGFEKSGVWNVWRLAKALCDEWAGDPVLDALRWNVEVIIVPVGNPHSYDQSPPGVVTRTNANGVDIARNFREGWVQGTAGTSTYGGTAPLSEPEAIILDQLMRDVADRAVFGSSFHSYTAAAGTQNMIWQAAPSELMLNLGKQVIARMSRKWHVEQAWITDTRTYFGYSDLGSPGGSEGRQMSAYGIPGATFETARNQYLDGGSGERHTDRAMTLAYEATVNYVAMGVNLGIRL